MIVAIKKLNVQSKQNIIKTVLKLLAFKSYLFRTVFRTEFFLIFRGQNSRRRFNPIMRCGLRRPQGLVRVQNGGAK